MNEQLIKIGLESGMLNYVDNETPRHYFLSGHADEQDLKKFAELIVQEMCGLMEQAEDDAYHCFEPSERPTEYIAWLNQWRTRFEEHFGVEE